MVFEIIFEERELGIGIIFAYLFFFLIVRMLLIAIPWHRWVRSQIKSMRYNICFEHSHSDNDNSKQFHTCIKEQANCLLDKADELIKSDKNLDFFFWGGSHEVDAMLMVYEADRHRVCILSEEELHARIKWAMTEIGVLSKDKQDAWRAVFGNTQKKNDKEFDEEFYKKIGKNLDRCRAYLNQLLGDLHDVLIKELTAQFNLLNKAVWLVLIGLLLATGLMLSGYGLILLAGAVGGLLSRLQRVIFTTNFPKEYSVYWVSLFSSPMVGALAAWAGLVIVFILQKLQILSFLDSIGITELQNPTSNPIILGLAVIFGISERLLDSLTKQVEGKLSPEKEKGTVQT